MLTVIIIMSIFQTAVAAAALALAREALRGKKNGAPAPERGAREAEEERAFREGLRSILRYGGEP
jgi:hypothetical protein